MSERYYGLLIEESCAACAWESANGYIRDSRTGRLMNHKHDARYEIALVFGSTRAVLFTSTRVSEPVTVEPREFWTITP